MSFQTKPEFTHRGVGAVFNDDVTKNVPNKYALIHGGCGPGTSNPTIDEIRRRIEANPLACIAISNQIKRTRKTLIKLAIDSVLDEKADTYFATRFWKQAINRFGIDADKIETIAIQLSKENSK